MSDTGNQSPDLNKLPSGVSHGREVSFVLPYGFLALFASFGSLAVCYSTVLLSVVTGQGSDAIGQGMYAHVQAVVMWSLALLAVFALWNDRQVHNGQVALVLGGIAALVLIAVLYVKYDQRIEMLAYILLTISALLNQHHFLNHLNRTVHSQAASIKSLNQELMHQVRDQGDEINKLGRLRDFLAPQIAEKVVQGTQDELLESRRKYVACLFCDIRNFTSFSEAVEPEEVITVLQRYHDKVGCLVENRNGTIGCRAGDGVMVFFNDPITCEKPVLEAVKLSNEIISVFSEVSRPLARLGHEIGIGVGIAAGYATVGVIGVQGRGDYTAIGNVVNIAARLCDQAADGTVLLTKRAYLEVEGDVSAEDAGSFHLKGISRAIEAHRLTGML